MNRRAFSLIEVCAAVIILALIVSSMLGVLWQGNISMQNSRERAIAYTLAIEKLEDKLSANPWPPANEALASVSGFSGFQRQVNIVCPYLGFSDLAHITVTVWWDNATKSQAFETLKANY